MRILFLSQRSWPSVGGIEHFQWQVATGLAARHEVTILAERTDSGEYDRLDGTVRQLPFFAGFERDGVRVSQLRVSGIGRALLVPLAVNSAPVFRAYAYGRMRKATAAWFGRVAGRDQPLIREAAQHDVLHVWGGDYVAAAGVQAARKAGIPVIITPFAHAGQWGDDPGSAASYRKADAVIGLLKADAKLYRGLGVSPSRLRICGVCSPGVARGGGAALRQAFDLIGPVVLFLGVRRAYKGFSRLLEAAPTIARLVPEATLAFVGPGPPVMTDGVPLRVIDAGQVDQKTRAAWLDAADLMVLPSDGEVFPVSILEAFSVGTPVLTSELETLRELVECSGGGRWAAREPEALGRAIGEVLTQPELLRSLGRAGQRFWEMGHTVEAVTTWHENLYASIRTERKP